MIATASSPSALWYVARGTGAVSLVLLSLSFVLGVTGVRRLTPSARVPRFLVDGLHRNVSLLVVALLLVHILTSMLDPFAHIQLLDAVVPLASGYRPLWLGFGALAFDLLIALTITSVLRRRLGLRAWKAVHWTAYACWPVAVLHGLGAGSDAKTGWLQILVVACVVSVVVATAARLAAGWPAHARRTLGGVAAVVAAVGGLVVFALAGPLAAGWARRAGTPASLLGLSSSAAAVPVAVTLPLAGRVRGTVRRGTGSDGSARVRIVGSVAASGQDARVAVTLVGDPLAAGGLSLRSSSVTLGSTADALQYTGAVTALRGSDISAALRAADGQPIALRLSLRIPAGSSAVTGTAAARAAR